MLQQSEAWRSKLLLDTVERRDKQEFFFFFITVRKTGSVVACIRGQECLIRRVHPEGYVSFRTF